MGDMEGTMKGMLQEREVHAGKVVFGKRNHCGVVSVPAVVEPLNNVSRARVLANGDVDDARKVLESSGARSCDNRN
jgi:hypothetical protein